MSSQAIHAAAILATGFCAEVFLLMLLSRNGRTFEYRSEVIDYMRRNPEQAAGQSLMEEYDSVSYDEMALKFWRPLRSFFPRYEKAREKVG